MDIMTILCRYDSISITMDIIIINHISWQYYGEMLTLGYDNINTYIVTMPYYGYHDNTMTILLAFILWLDNTLQIWQIYKFFQSKVKVSEATVFYNIKLVKSTFTGCPVKLFPLCNLLFCRLLLIQIAKVWTFLKNSENLLHDRHKNFENRFRNSWDNWGQS